MTAVHLSVCDPVGCINEKKKNPMISILSDGVQAHLYPILNSREREKKKKKKEVVIHSSSSQTEKFKCKRNREKFKFEKRPFWRSVSVHHLYEL